MKLEIIVKSKDQILRTKDLVVKINGKKLEGNLSFLQLNCNAEIDVIYWKFGLQGNSFLYKLDNFSMNNFWFPFKRFYIKSKYFLKDVKRFFKNNYYTLKVILKK